MIYTAGDNMIVLSNNESAEAYEASKMLMGIVLGKGRQMLASEYDRPGYDFITVGQNVESSVSDYAGGRNRMHSTLAISLVEYVGVPSSQEINKVNDFIEWVSFFLWNKNAAMSYSKMENPYRFIGPVGRPVILSDGRRGILSQTNPARITLDNGEVLRYGDFEELIGTGTIHTWDVSWKVPASSLKRLKQDMESGGVEKVLEYVKGLESIIPHPEHMISGVATNADVFNSKSVKSRVVESVNRGDKDPISFSEWAEKMKADHDDIHRVSDSLYYTHYDIAVDMKNKNDKYDNDGIREEIVDKCISSMESWGLTIDSRKSVHGNKIETVVSFEDSDKRDSGLYIARSVIDSLKHVYREWVEKNKIDVTAEKFGENKISIKIDSPIQTPEDSRATYGIKKDVIRRIDEVMNVMRDETGTYGERYVEEKYINKRWRYRFNISWNNNEGENKYEFDDTPFEIVEVNV